MTRSESVRVRLGWVLCALLLAMSAAGAEDEADLAIAGRVLDDAGRPVARYALRAAPPAGVTRYGYEPPQAVTDAQGRFLIEGLVAGRYKLYAGDCDTHAKMDPQDARAGSSDVVIRVLRYRTIEGVARDPAGKPLVGCAVSVGRKPPRPGAHVPTQTRGREFLHRGTTTDDQGRFRIERYPSIHPVQLSVAVPAGREQEWLPILVDAVVPGAAPLELVAPPAEVIAGVVRGEDGKPVAGAKVSSRGPGTIKGRLPLVRWQAAQITDAEGRFELRPFEPGMDVSVNIEGPGGKGAGWFPEYVKDVRTGSRDLAIVLRRGLAVRGAIVGVPAAALRGADVTAYVDSRKVAAHVFDGSTTAFLLRPVPRDLVELRVHSKRGTQLTGPRPAGPGRARIFVEAPASDVRITMAIAHVLRGRVNAPEGVTRIRVSYHDAWGRLREASRLLDAGATFEIRDVPAGPGQLYAGTRYGTVRALLDDVDPAQGPYVLELTEGTTIRGRIQGLPAAVRIGSVTARRGRYRYTTRLPPDGTFETEKLPPGRWTLEFDVGDPVGGIVPTLKDVEAGRQDVVALWDADR